MIRKFKLVYAKCRQGCIKNSNSIKPLGETENRIVKMENRLDFFFYNLASTFHMTQQSPSLIFTKISKIYVHTKSFYTNMCSSFIGCSKNLNTTQISINRKTDK